MTTFNAADAAFHGFKLVTKDPVLWVVLSVVQAAISIAAMLVILPAMGPILAFAEQSAAGAAPPDPSDVLAAYGAFLSRVWWVIPAAWAVAVVIQGAILRFLIFGRRVGWVAGLQLGADELRLAVVNTLIYVFIFVLYFIGALTLGVVVGLTGVAALVWVGVFAVLAAVIYFGVRLSASAAASVGERGFLVLAGWRLSKGRFWSLFGAHVMLVFIGIVATLAGFILSTLLGATFGANMVDPTGGSVDPELLRALVMNPGYLIATLIQSFVGMALTAAWVGVGAYVYLTLGAAAGYSAGGPEAERQISTFE